MLEFAITAPFFALLIVGTARIAQLAFIRYRLALVTHAVMREAAAGVTDARALTVLANAYARTGGLGEAVPLAVLVERAAFAQPASMGAGMFRSLAQRFTPGSRIRVRCTVPLRGLVGAVFPHGLSMECAVVVMADPWKSPFRKLWQWMTGAGG